MSRRLMVVDCETTGLDVREHMVVEVAWAGLTGPVTVLRLPHDASGAHPEALEINGYVERGLGDPAGWASAGEIEALHAALRGVTLVGSNPAFDARFLAEFFREFPWLSPEPWHHRHVDVATYAMCRFGWSEPRGLVDVVGELRDRGHEVPWPDHTAGGDVVATRAAFLALSWDEDADAAARFAARARGPLLSAERFRELAAEWGDRPPLAETLGVAG